VKAVISATGLWTPEDSISNEELVEAFNKYVDKWNSENADEIAAGTKDALEYSNAPFIEKASGIKSRYVISKAPILNPDIMAPHIPARDNTEISVLAEIAVNAAKKALEKVGRKPEDVDLIYGGQAKSVLVVNPEICTAHLNFKDRDAHFIFGDVATAILVERDDIAPAEHWEIIHSKLVTKFSNNIRNNFGFLNHCAPEDDGMVGDRGKKGLTDKLFVQNGRSVFKEVVPMVAKMITAEAEAGGIALADLKRMWLHQANLSMNVLIAKKVLGKDVDIKYAPVVLDEYANTSSAGSIIAFDKHSDDFEAGETGLICSFGAGYSAGAVFVRKVA